VTALVAVGFQLKFDPPSHSATNVTTTSVAPATSTTAHTPSSTTTTTTLVSTTTHPSGNLAPLPSPEVNAASFAPPGRGCHFNTGSPTPTTTTTNATTLPSSHANALRNVPTTVSGRCTVLEIGDSLGNDLGWGLARELGSDHVLRLVQADKSSSGLTTPWFYDWPAKEKVLLAQYHPQLVIATFGGNDEQNLRVDGHVVAFASAPWIAAYTKIVRGIATAATKNGAYVLWVGMPIMGPTTYRANMAVINSVFLKVERSVPGMTFLPVWDLFANAQGHYTNAAPVNQVPTVLRSSDGIHFSYVGENVFATYVAHELAKVYHVLQVADDQRCVPRTGDAHEEQEQDRDEVTVQSLRTTNGILEEVIGDDRAEERPGDLDLARPHRRRRVHHLQRQVEPHEVPQVQRVRDVADVAKWSPR
jgi:hypothetical protein